MSVYEHTPPSALGVFSQEATSPPGFKTVGIGGVQAIMPGASQITTLDLESGSYVLLCGILNPEGGLTPSSA